MSSRLLKGFRDLMSVELLPRDTIISTIKSVYESYGFVPLNTPSLEYKSTLYSYGEEAGKQIYTFTDPDEEEVGLRFDLTAPLARVVAGYPELPMPYKRYQIQTVWRYDKPDPGRYREFMQCDIDIAGSRSITADSEILEVMHAALSALNLNFKIRYSSRKLLNTLIRFAGLEPEMGNPVFRILDKLDKQGKAAVLLELGEGRVDASGAKIRGLGLPATAIQAVDTFLSVQQETREEALASLKAILSGVDGADEAIADLEAIHIYLAAAGINSDRVAIDVSIARGLEYYTGAIFEAVLVDQPGFGSIMGGGRYDNLVGVFKGDTVPAVGASIGVDRLYAALTASGKIKSRQSTADVLMTVMMPERLNDYRALADTLRKAGISTMLYNGDDKKIRDQLKFADRAGIPIVVIVGSNEFDENKVSIKDLRVTKTQKIETGDRKEYLQQRVGQMTIPMDEMVAQILHLRSLD